MTDLRRRALCAGAVATAAAPGWAGAAESGVGERDITLGQIIALSGPLAEITPDIVNASAAWFATVNDGGGINGRKVRVLTLDDGYLPANTVQAARQLLEQDRAFALLNLTGTGNVAAILPMLEQENVPLIGPITGADVLRNPTPRNLFHLRASYGDETEKIVQHLATIGTERISVVSLDNGMGKDGLAGFERAMQKRSLRLHSMATVRPDASDVDAAVAALLERPPQAIVMITTGKATVDFIRKYNRLGKGMRFYALSVMGTQSTLRALGADGVGVVVTSVVPYPWSRSSPVAIEYRAAMERSGFNNLSFMGFEAYLNARLITEGLRRAGRALTRNALVGALENMRQYNLSGFDIGFSRQSHQGSRFVGLTIIGPGERFMQ